jgi:hypothetical protein
MDTEQKKEYNRIWREKNPDYNKNYLRKWRKTSNYEMVKMKLRKSGFYLEQAIKRKDYHKVYSNQRWVKKKQYLNTINDILGLEEFVKWMYIPKTAYNYAISDTGIVFDCKNEVKITPYRQSNTLLVDLPFKNKTLTLKVPYVVLKSFSKDKKKKRHWIEYKDGDFRNCSIFNLMRVYPIERLLKSQFYKDIKSVGFSFHYYVRKFKKNIDFSK